MKYCKIMRGAPGAGKSYWARRLFPSALILSTDNLFTVDGVYNFDPTLLPVYHDKTLVTFLHALQDSVDTIVVDNTNARVYEIAPYYRLAQVFGYDVEIVHVVADPENCKVNNTHNVPHYIIDQHQNNTEAIPHWWRVRFILNT